MKSGKFIFIIHFTSKKKNILKSGTKNLFLNFIFFHLNYVILLIPLKLSLVENPESEEGDQKFIFKMGKYINLYFI